MDCVFDFGYKCVALTCKKCEGCCFRKTQEQLEAGRKRAKKRINSLPAEIQAYIRDKYIFRSEK